MGLRSINFDGTIGPDASCSTVAEKEVANEAARVAAEAIAKVEQIAKNAVQRAELLNLALMDAVAAVEKRLSGKAVAIEGVPKEKGSK